MTTSFSFVRQFKLYHPDGSLKVIYHLKKKMLNGEYVAFYSSGQIATKGQFLNGVRNGEWFDWYKDGSLAIKRVYESGFESIVEGKWPNGQTAFKGRYQNATRSGSWIFKDSLGENCLGSNAFVFSIKSEDERNRLEWIFGSRSTEYLVENEDLKANESGLYYSFSRYMQSADDDNMEWYCSLNVRINGLIKKGNHIENWYYMDENGYPLNAIFNEYNELLYTYYDKRDKMDVPTDDYKNFLATYKYDVFEKTMEESEYDSVTAYFHGEEYVGYQSAENKYVYHLANHEYNVKKHLKLHYDTLSQTLFLTSRNSHGYDSITCEYFFHVWVTSDYPSFDLYYPIGQVLYFNGGKLANTENYVRINKQLSPSDYYVLGMFSNIDSDQMISKRHGELIISTGEIFTINKGFVVDIENKK